MSKQKRKMSCFLMVSLLIGTLFTLTWMYNTENTYAAGFKAKQLKDLKQGDEISFAGQDWVVLEPEEGYIFMKAQLELRQFDEDGTNKFNPMKESNIGYYLNTIYYNTLTDEEKEAILPKTWGIGHEGDENGEILEAKIGLLSYREWHNDYGQFYGGFVTLPRGMWLRTPRWGKEDTAWVITPDGRTNRYQADSLSYVHPALTLDPEIFVTAENKVILVDEDIPVKQLKNLEQGNEFSFAGADWIVLEPEEGYIFMKDVLVNRPFGTESNKFNLTNTNNIGHYLNSEYYDSNFNNVEKSVILTKEWGIEGQDESSETLEANIGLLSYQEWYDYGQLYGGFLAAPSSGMWLRTPFSSNMIWSVWQDGRISSVHMSFNLAVRPALRLNPESFVSSKNGVILPDVVFEPNGTNRWAKGYQTTVTVGSNFGRISEVEYAWSTETTRPSEGWKTLDGESATIQTPAEASGVYYLHIQGEDEIGGDFHVYSNVFKIDNTKPTAPDIDASAEWTNDGTVEIIAGTDKHSSVARTEYRIGKESDWITYENPLDITEEGETVIYARTVDQAENVSEIVQTTVKIDQTAPEIILNGDAKLIIELGGNYKYGDVIVKDNYDGTVNDSIEIIGEVDTNQLGTYEVTYMVRDHSENTATVTRIIEVVDTSAPSDITFEATEVGADYVVFTFFASDNAGIKEYILLRDGEEIGRIDGKETTYKDKKLQAGTSYYYELVAIDPSENASSAASIEVTTANRESLHSEDRLVTSMKEKVKPNAKDRMNNERQTKQSNLFEEKTERLPDTATHQYNWIWIGFLLFAMGTIMWQLGQKKQKKE